jgi:hypothetical protein
MHLASGEAVHLFVDPDPATGRPEYGLQRLRLDPGGGGHDGSSAIEDPRTFDDAETWRQAAGSLRRYLDGE